MSTLGVNGNGNDGPGPFSRQDEPSHQPQKRRKTDVDAPGNPSKDILHGLSDGIERAEDADVGIMQHETAEVIADMAVDYAQETALNSLVQSLIELLTTLPKKEVDASKVSKFMADLDFTPTRPFIFQAPTTVELVGSYAARCACRLSPYADLAVEIPRECFDSKDQLNHRYHAKRVLYLSHLAKTISRQPGVAAVHWAPGPGSDPRSPCLIVDLEQSSSENTSTSGMKLRIFPVLPIDTFPAAKLAPSRNNLRTAQDAAGEPVPTPQYNTSVLRDMMIREHSKTLNRAAQAVPHFRHAVVLLKAWAAQQRLCDGADGVSGFFLTMVLIHLLEKGQATSGMTAIHLFRTTVAALTKPKFLISGSSLPLSSSSSTSSTTPPPGIKAFRAAGHEVILLDSSGWLNLGAPLSAAALRQAAACAVRTVAAVPSGGPEAIDSAFFAQRSLSSLYDVWYHIKVPSTKAGSGSGNGNGNGGQLSLGDVPPWRAVEKDICRLVTKALSTRASLVRVVGRKAKSMSPDKGSPGPEHTDVIVGARLDATAALSSVDKGPAADSGDAAQKFREFWGEKSELRRFLDGSISEAVVWESGTAGRHLIVDQIVEYCVKKHLPRGASVTASAAGLLDAALLRADATPDEELAAERACQAAAERLGKKLRAVDSVALRVVAVQPLAPVLRHAALFPPLPHPLAGGPGGLDGVDAVPRCLEPVELLCQLEGTGRWPDAVEPYEKMKAALGVQLAITLQQEFGIDAQASEDYVDVLTDGFAFRLRLAAERDDAMQRKALEEAGLSLPPPELDIHLRLWHHGVVSAATAANPAYQPTLRLAKRWIAAHLLSAHVREEAIELLVAVAFAEGAGLAAPSPSTRTSGFLRFLLLLANHPWSVQPVVVGNVPGEPAAQDRKSAAGRAHAALRQSGTVPAMFISGPDAGTCVGWTVDQPSSQMMWRVVVLARRSVSLLEAVLAGNSNNNAMPANANAASHQSLLASIFSRDLEEYDAVIQLRSDALTNASCDLQFSQSNSTKGRRSKEERNKVVVDKQCRAILKGIPRSVIQARGVGAVRKELLVGFDPVRIFIAAIQRRFGGIATFCADYLGGSRVIGIKWLPAALQPGPLIPDYAHTQRPAASPTEEAAVANGSESSKKKKRRSSRSDADGDGCQTMVELDVQGVLSDIQALGAGLIDTIDMQ